LLEAGLFRSTPKKPTSIEQEEAMKLRTTLYLCAALAAAIPLSAGAEELYTVRKGDSLSRIARWHGVPTDALKGANGLASDRLKPGMKLTIPVRGGNPESVAPSPATARRSSSAGGAAASVLPSETQYHRVEKGETLSAIAGIYGMSVRELKGLNHIRKPKRLRAGTAILVRKPAAPAQQEAETAPPATAASTPPPASGGNGKGGIKERLIEIAHAMLDIPYRFGGNSLLGIDCSGYVQKVFGLLDIVLPRTAREQFRLGKLVGKDDLSIGDLVFFRTYAKFPSHVGIYLGENRFIHASSTDRKVTIDSMDAPYYLKRFIGARRLPLDEPADGI
jgi:cell wall-associated NlpC family hydrolase